MSKHHTSLELIVFGLVLILIGMNIFHMLSAGKKKSSESYAAGYVGFMKGPGGTCTALASPDKVCRADVYKDSKCTQQGCNTFR